MRILKPIILPFCLLASMSGPVSWAAEPDVSELAFYGLTSWYVADESNIYALMPRWSLAGCLRGTGLDQDDKHFPVLKIVSGHYSWDGPPLRKFESRDRIFDLSGQHVELEGDQYFKLKLAGFEQFSSDEKLRLTLPWWATPVTPVPLKTEVLGDSSAADAALAARIKISKGRVVAGRDSHCPLDWPEYGTQTLPDSNDCQSASDPSTVLAERVVVTLQHKDKPYVKLAISGFDDTRRSLIVTSCNDEDKLCGPVRVEISYQQKAAAVQLNTAASCPMSSHLEAYRLFYDLGAAKSCPPHYHCRPRIDAGGTKCPQRLWVLPPS